MSNSKSNASDKYLAILGWLSHENFRKYHVPLAKKLGSIEACIILEDMMDCYRHYQKNNELISHVKYGDGLFYYKEEKAYERCAIKVRSFNSAIELFTELGFFEVVCRFGIPPVRYFRFNFEVIYNYIFTNLNSNNFSNHAQKHEYRCSKASIKMPKSMNLYDTNNDPKKDPNKRSPYNPPPEKEKSFSFKEEKIVFDPKTYKLKNGESLKPVTALSYVKKMKDPQQAAIIIANVAWYEKQFEDGISISKHEAYLQNAITKNMASKADRAWKNEIYAKIMKSEHNLSGLNILKTVVQLDKKDGSKPESISLNLPGETFSDAIDNYVITTKEN